MTYDDLGARDQALFDEAGGSDGTFVSARMVDALQGNGNAAIFLSQLMKWSKWKGDSEGWFFRTRKEMQKQCGLSDTAQRTAEKTLVSLGLVETDHRGMPAKKHYRLNISSIISLLAGDEKDVGGSGGDKSSGVTPQTSSGGYPAEQVVGGSPDNSIENNTKSNKENNTGSSSTRPRDAVVDGLWDFLPEEHTDVKADIQSAYEELLEGRVDVPMLAKRYLTRNGQSAPFQTVSNHIQNHHRAKIVAAYVVAGIKANQNPTSYACTILDEDWTHRNGETDNDTFEDKARRIWEAAGRGAGVDGF